MLRKLKAALQEKRLHQYELARQIGITDTRLSRIIVERVTATDDEKNAIARALRMPALELFEVAAAKKESGA